MLRKASTPWKKTAAKQVRTGLLPLVAGCFFLAACGSTDLDSIEADTFLEQAMPTWLMPKMRDDYMAKRWIQPFNAARAVERDEQGDPVLEISFWTWPRGFPWPWPLPNPSPAR